MTWRRAKLGKPKRSNALPCPIAAHSPALVPRSGFKSSSISSWYAQLRVICPHISVPTFDNGNRLCRQQLEGKEKE